MKIADSEEKNFLPRQTGRHIPSDIKQQILRAIASIEYGSVEVVIHDGKIVQIESREKVRVGRPQTALGVITG
jgi:hypothetical protein